VKLRLGAALERQDRVLGGAQEPNKGRADDLGVCAREGDREDHGGDLGRVRCGAGKADRGAVWRDLVRLLEGGRHWAAG
jgi:hypothetical protein